MLGRAALRRGVRVRCLYNADVLNDPEMLAYLTAMTKAGEQARFLRTVPLKLYVADGALALLPLTGKEAGSRFRAVVVQRSALTDALHALFEVLWRQATALGGTGPERRDSAPPAGSRRECSRASVGGCAESGTVMRG